MNISDIFVSLYLCKVWEYLEEGKMRVIAKDVSRGYKLDSEDKVDLKRNITKFIMNQNKTSGHKVYYLILHREVHSILSFLKKYAFGYVLCLFLNLLNSVMCIINFNTFLDGNFWSIGSNSWPFQEDEARRRFMKKVFPRLAMCKWRQFGTGGGIETTNYLCMLNSNIITEKIFNILWFWLLFLTITSFFNFSYYAIVIFSKNDTIRY